MLTVRRSSYQFKRRGKEVALVPSVPGEQLILSVVVQAVFKSAEFASAAPALPFLP